MSNTPTPLHWHFPLPRPHAGTALGNGQQGLLIWGETSLLLTVAHAGFWDRRNGMGFLPDTTFTKVRQALEARDDSALTQLFPRRPEGAAFPQQMGGGRLELTFPEGLRPFSAALDLTTAEVTVSLGRHEEDSEKQTLRIRQCVEENVIWVEGEPTLLAGLGIKLTAAFDLVREGAMAACGLQSPQAWGSQHEGGFEQTLPQDAPLAVAWARREHCVLLTTALGETAVDDVKKRLSQFDVSAAARESESFWAAHWENAARVNLPDPILQRQYDYGLFRQAGLIRAHAPAATLQGPWMEDTTLVPWSNDYHFNINVQLVYGAALATGHAKEMQPLWDMLQRWLPKLREYGEGFFGLPGAMILPHAVDDRCQMLGSFWAGAIDQACVAWMGRMSWQHYLFTGDLEHLKNLTYPMLNGAFLGYYAMLEKVEDGAGGFRYSLPVSVSPEFGGSDIEKCWGRDASFQLAALHSTINSLRAAAPMLALVPDPRWAEVAAHLPAFSLVEAKNASYGWIGQPAERIALWEGMDLPESHRHHSHLASIYPFCTIDPFDPTFQKIAARSLNWWNTLGAGNWTGWCVPWASVLCSRSGLTDSALSWLHLLDEQFTNEGHATLHNANAAGMFAWDDGSLAWPNHRKGSDFQHYEIMQLDAAMGALTAILELFISNRDGIIHITDRLPKGWRELSVSRVRVEGGFELDLDFRHGQVNSIRVHSSRGGELNMTHSLGTRWTLDGVEKSEHLSKVVTKPNQTLTYNRIY